MERPKMQYGYTGNPERDGILTAELQHDLDVIQRETAQTLLEEMGLREFAPNPLEVPHPMAAMATGIGKGKIMYHLINEYLKIKPDARILILGGTKTVLTHQINASLAEYSTQESASSLPEALDMPEDDTFDESPEALVATLNLEAATQAEQAQQTAIPSFIAGRRSKKAPPNQQVDIDTIQGAMSGLRRGTMNYEDYDFVIADEVHNLGTKKRRAAITNGFPRMVGLTATPIRTQGMEHPEEYGFRVVRSLPLNEAQQAGFLPPLVGLQYDTTALIDEVPLKQDGEINYPVLERILKNSPDLRPYIAEKLVELFVEHGKAYKTVVAVNFVWEALELAKLLKERGVKVGVAVNSAEAAKINAQGEIPASDALERYKLPAEDENALQVLISPYVAGEGFDAPATEMLVWASPTESPLRYTQYTGRLARRFPGKAYGILVDFLFQTDKFRWSYNMGMWMKDQLRQMDNGLLFMGRDEDAQRFMNLPEFKAAMDSFSRHSARISLEALADDGNQPLKPTEFALRKAEFTARYRGSYERVWAAYELVLNTLETQFRSTLVQRTLESGSTVRACTNPVLIDGLMRRFGFEPKIQDIMTEDDIHIEVNFLRKHFVGNGEDLSLRVARIAEEHPELFEYKIKMFEAGGKQRKTRAIRSLSKARLYELEHYMKEYFNTSTRQFPAY